MKYICLLITVVLNTLSGAAQKRNGATVPWTTYEAENMHTTGVVMGPGYEPYQVETESSGQKCVKLISDQNVEFTAAKNATSMVIRYSLPNAIKGRGLNSALAVYQNGKLIQHAKITSHYNWVYGEYPFTSDPAAGKPRHFYNEIRIKDLKLQSGDRIRIQRDDNQIDNAGFCIIDLVDLENVSPSLIEPANSLAVTDKMFGGPHHGDYTAAFINCISKASQTGKSVWIPPGSFKITGDIILPENITIQGAGMWYTELVGDSVLYTNADRRVRLKGEGSNIHIADFAIIGKLNYRNDKEPNDGIVGSFGINSTISNLWIEHTKVGMWIENSQNLEVTGCRMRNTMADGINFCVGMRKSTIENCTARGTGDDCFAIWPSVYSKQQFEPGQNLITHCSAQLPYLANGAAIYGGKSNEIKNCSFTDISQGSAILISTTFPTESKDKNIYNNFSGTTLVEDCDIKTSGGFDHEWDWRASVEICIDKRSISGIEMNNLHIDSSLSNGVSIIAKNEPGKICVLSNSTLKNIDISNAGIGVKDKYGLFVSGNAHGSLIIKNSNVSSIHNESKDFALIK